MWSRVARGEQDGRERHEGGTRRGLSSRHRWTLETPSRYARSGQPDERDAVAKQSKLDWLILGGIAIAVVLAAGALGMGVLSYVSSPDAVAGPQGPTGAPGRNRTTRSPRRAWATGFGRGNGAGRCEGGDRAHGPQGPAGATGPVLGGRLVRPEQLERAARSSRAQRCPEPQCSRRSIRPSARPSPPRRPAPKVTLRSEVVRRFLRPVSRARASLCDPRTQRARTAGGPWDR